jgi:hypothetical protein
MHEWFGDIWITRLQTQDERSATVTIARSPALGSAQTGTASPRAGSHAYLCIKGGLDGRAIASTLERSSGAGHRRDPDVAT